MLLVLVLLIVAVGAFAGFYSGATPKLTVESALKGIGRRTPIQIRIDDPQRVEKVRVEVVQNLDVKPVLEKTFEPQPAWKFWGSPPPVVLRADVGRETVQGLRSGEATVRVTAERAGSLFRRPDPVVEEIKLPVRLAPPTLQISSSFHYVNQGGCEAVVYRVGEGAVRDGVQSGDLVVPELPDAGQRPADALRPLRRPLRHDGRLEGPPDRRGRGGQPGRGRRRRQVHAAPDHHRHHPGHRRLT